MPFLRKVRKFLLGEGALVEDAHGNPPSKELQIAVAVLLLETAYADSHCGEEERREIYQDLAFSFGISKRELEERLAEANRLMSSGASLEPFIAQMNRQFSIGQRIEVLSLVWRVIDADEQIKDFECSFADSLIRRLELTPEQGQQARERSRAYIKEQI